LYTKLQRSVDFCGPCWMETQTGFTAAPDIKDGHWKCPVSAEMSCTVCKCKFGSGGQYTLVCQMQATQLLIALCPLNAQKTSSLLCGNVYKINGI
jgi:hypothetical protein